MTFVEHLQELRVRLVKSLAAVAAGSVLGWHHALLHWGGRANPRASGPRISMSIEYQRADAEAFNEPLLDPARLPPFERRLGLVGKQILQYDHMYDPDDQLVQLANELHARFPI